MTATRGPTNKEIQEAFDEVMETIHRGVPTDCGFNPMVQAALIDYSLQPDNEDLASRARVALKQQFEGTYEQHDDDDWTDAIRSVR